MTYKILTVIAVLTLSFAVTTTAGHNKNSRSITPEIVESPEPNSLEEEISLTYQVFKDNNATVPALESFRNALVGYYKLSDQGLVKKEILTIIDFSLSSTKKRLWVLDMANNKVLIHSLVAHGRNTGGEFATKFSNKVNSLQSSLGFYITGETYYGGNGLSLYIDGMEEDFNSKARERYVVVHGADYANEDSIKKLGGRLGRSYGCPAVPRALTKELIETIKENSVLYIHSKDKIYARKSEMIKA